MGSASSTTSRWQTRCELPTAMQAVVRKRLPALCRALSLNPQTFDPVEQARH